MRTVMAKGATAVLAGLLLVGCSGGDGGADPTGGAGTGSGTGATSGDTATGGTGGTGGMPASVDADLDALDPESLDVQGTATGTVEPVDTPITADVLRVARRDGGLDLTLRLTPEEEISSFPFSQGLSEQGSSSEITAVRLVAGEEYVAPLTYRAQEKWDIEDVRCLCSKLPRQLGTDGFVVRASYPDLAEPVDTVTVTIPGFDDIEDVPVG